MTGQQRAEGAGQPLIGSPAPKLVLTTIDGRTIDLGKLYGKQAVYLKFWDTWCIPCREQMPHFEHTYETAGPDLAVIAIDTGFNDSAADVRAFRSKTGIKMPIVVDDGHAAAAFNLRVTPQHIVIGRDGRIQYVGHLADARLDAALVAARTSSAGTADPPAPTLPAIHHYQIGDRLQAESPETIDGARFQLRDPDGKHPTVLVFLWPSCESYLAQSRPTDSANCRRMREEVDAVAQPGSPGGAGQARWLGIAYGLWATPEELREYGQHYGVHIPLSLDASGALFHAFNVNQVPVAFVVDGSGRIVRRIDAQDLGNNAGALREAINAR
jgi:peroxiredoxin